MASLTKNGILINEQFGFRSGPSVNLQLLDFVNYLIKNINLKIPIDVIYLDFKKAFDTVPFRRLLLKVEFTGIVGNALRWIENFLLNRHQMVRVRDNLSGMEEVASEVPQGSVLGPLLFLIYVADLPGIISKNLKIRMFADDTKIY